MFPSEVRFLLLLLILEILLLYCHQDYCYNIYLILVILHAHPCACLIYQQSLPQFLLQDHIQGYLHQILHLNSLLCRPKWVFIVPIQTLDIGQMWVVYKIF